MVFPGKGLDESAQAATATAARVDSATRVISTFLTEKICFADGSVGATKSTARVG